MKFGQATYEGGVIPFLPKDHPLNASNSGSQKPVENLRIYAGGTQWTMKNWVGTVYPENARVKDYLKWYGAQFNSIELNATHYRLYPEDHLVKWADQVPADFKFCPKVPQSISHYRRLRDTGILVADFTSALQGLGNKRGPAFLQMPENFKADHFKELMLFLSDWPAEVELSLELRHKSWFEDEFLLDDLITHLRNLGMGFVLTDTPARRDVLHMALTSSFTIIRFVGQGDEVPDKKRIGEWAIRLKDWKKQGLERVFFFVHQPMGAKTPETLHYLAESFIALGEGGLRVMDLK